MMSAGNFVESNGSSSDLICMVPLRESKGKQAAGTGLFFPANSIYTSIV